MIINNENDRTREIRKTIEGSEFLTTNLKAVYEHFESDYVMPIFLVSFADNKTPSFGDIIAEFERIGLAGEYSIEVLPYAPQHGEDGDLIWRK